MTTEFRQLAEQYVAALRNHVSRPDKEELLFQAYEIGRAAIDRGAGVLDMVRLHHAALREMMTHERPLDEELIDTAAEFFAEALSSFEMLLRGYRESNALLVETNEMLRRAQASAELANRELERLATTDSLTGVNNRRHFHALAAQEVARSTRAGHRLSAVAIDIDQFKPVNDRYGHGAGDETLCRVAEAAKAELRSNDLFARMGGDEFTALLPDTDIVGALRVAERVRARIADIVIQFEGLRFGVTVSVGVAGFSPADDTIHATLVKADLALYRAKAEGRNRVCLPPDQGTK
jgi:diguanylate cyclase (GGDEF)-like protein